MQTNRETDLRLVRELLKGLAPLSPSERSTILSWINGPGEQIETIDAPCVRLAQMLSESILREKSSNNTRLCLTGLEFHIDGCRVRSLAVCTDADGSDFLPVQDDVSKRVRPLTFLDLALDPRPRSALRSAGDGFMLDNAYDHLCDRWENRIGSPLWTRRWLIKFDRCQFDENVLDHAKRLVRDRYGWYSPHDPVTTKHVSASSA